MKLVEILASELEVWPRGALFVDQASDGDLIANFNHTDDNYQYLGVREKAEDWIDAKITQYQWQAERDRMSKMEALIEARDNPPSPEPTYEQQLWDRVAYRAWELGANDCRELDSVIRGCAIVADAFMAERAKRVGK